jgi:aryl-alcohol dehydrogenase-like predicted oxidoreductase
MEYRRLGRSGLQVSAIGLGTNNFGVASASSLLRSRRVDEQGTAAVVHQALELGVNFIDTSNTYGGGFSEEFIGKALKGRRDEVVLATKVASRVGEGPNRSGASRKHIMDQVEVSLKRLGTDYIDLYQIHFPDPQTPIQETLRTLDDLVRQGKVRYVGCSNFAAWQVCEALWTSKTLGLASFVSVQPEWNMLNRDVEREVVPLCMAYGLGIVPYYPLASGFLTGKYRPGTPVPEGTRFFGDARRQERALTERNYAVLGRLEAFAQAREHTVGELAIAWLLASPQVSSVIAGATRPEQVVANAVPFAWHLTAEDMQEIDGLLEAEG